MINNKKPNSGSPTPPNDLAPHISKEKLEGAREWAKTKPIGIRLSAAEKSLTLLAKDELPLIRHFLLNAEYDLRHIEDMTVLRNLKKAKESFQN